LTLWEKCRVKNAEKPAVFSAKKRENRVPFLICVRMLRSRYIIYLHTYTPESCVLREGFAVAQAA
jgi:hypothetical protein